MVDHYIILGHENPDVDSVVSGYLLEKLMRQKGYFAEFIIPDQMVDTETATICLEYGLDCRKYQKELPKNGDYRFILVDHHERNVDGVISCIIDHHPTNKDIQVNYYQNDASSSTSCLICTEENEMYFSKEDIQLAIVAAMVDTASFHSTKTREKDVLWVHQMCEKYAIDYDKIYKTGLCLTDLSDLSVATYNGLKKYSYGEHLVESSYIQIESREDSSSEIFQMIDLLMQHVRDTGLTVFVFIVHDMSLFQTTVYEISEHGFDVVEYSQYTSRGSTIMPRIEEQLMKQNQLTKNL